ncbi:hypothetical protein RHSIM_Rhsim03G0019800 [Rhododendron simsii]|uniref:RNase H type-1 domain-containing protein n=1 Tax=Rhododendron simsii TaxID=118357 RepID=A0A834LRZ8_RHOSS|nr:hypothetical protein RHSIM_Rhsim03G0019800 [Rhododendron simsii]
MINVEISNSCKPCKTSVPSLFPKPLITQVDPSFSGWAKVLFCYLISLFAFPLLSAIIFTHAASLKRLFITHLWVSLAMVLYNATSLGLLNLSSFADSNYTPIMDLDPIMFFTIVLVGLFLHHTDDGGARGLRQDDALLFSKAELHECRVVLDILRIYGEASGQAVNLDKSGQPKSKRSSKGYWKSGFSSLVYLEKQERVRFWIIVMTPPLAISAWRKPTPGSFKINCDVAMKREGLRANAVVVVRNDRGELTDGSTYSFKCSSVFQGELEAIRKACFLARDMCAVPVTIESDNKTAILLSASELVPPWEVYPLIMDIRAVKKQRNLEFIWFKRSANKVAHRVASLAAKGKLSLDWVANSPASLVSLLLHDVISVPL